MSDHSVSCKSQYTHEQAKREVSDLFDKSIQKVRELFGGIILVDPAGLEECVTRARESLASLHGIPKPNHFKRAGHHAYWIRKLKPLRVIDSAELARICKGIGIAIGDPGIVVKGSSPKYINELFAYIVGVGIVTESTEKLNKIKVSSCMLNDIIVTFRYETYSPSSLSLLFEALATDTSK